MYFFIDLSVTRFKNFVTGKKENSQPDQSFD